MKRHIKLITVIIVIFLVISVSINVVLAVTVANGTPGSDQDPIVSKSYVDSAVAQLTSTIQNLTTQLAALQTENEQYETQIAVQGQLIANMQEDIKKINTQLAINSTTNTNNNTTPTTTIGTGTVNTLSLNIRSKASTTASSLGSLKKGEIVSIISKSGDWYYIKTSKNLTGYVFAKYVTMN